MGESPIPLLFDFFYPGVRCGLRRRTRRKGSLSSTALGKEVEEKRINLVAGWGRGEKNQPGCGMGVGWGSKMPGLGCGAVAVTDSSTAG